MKLTNLPGLPEVLLRVFEHDSYERKSDFSVTELLQTPKIAVLRRRHDDEIVEDVSETIWRIYGRAIHSVFEHSPIVTAALKEGRMFAEIKIGGKSYLISGQADLYYDPASILDFKWSPVSVYLYNDGGMRDEWPQQLDMLAYLYRLNGFPVQTAGIVPIYKDFRRREAKSWKNYPAFPIAYIQHKPAESTKTARLVKTLVKRHADALDLPDNKLPECTAEERWDRGKGPLRCLEYCPVWRWCSFGIAARKEAEQQKKDK